ncbi:fibronectin type III domain-containing protein [uncultured Croceitalea sp.]|uniref:fibronectin type III domain-containing protein n=1 Tax=uncultured Croceitalea sp. TaxID=1798908 RepID=UPI003305AAC9
MKHTFSFSLLSALFIILWSSNIVAQCPNQLTNQSTSINLSPGYPRSGTAATGVQIGASCGLHIVGDLGATYARYEIPINIADNALVPGDQIEISMDITNVTANFRYDVRNGGNAIDASAEPISGRIITIPSGATNLVIRLFTNNGQNDISGSFDISNLSVSKVGAGGNDAQPPTAPTLSSAGQTETTANLSWSGATDNVGVTGYMVFKDGTLENTLGNVLSYNVTGLSSNTSYNFTVKALDAAGNESPLSNTVSVTTSSSADTQAPIAPTLVENGKTDATVNLSWSGATDDTAVTGYRIFKDGVLENTLANVDNYQVTGLTENTTYSFTATALDAAGNESTGSNAITVTTDASSGGGGSGWSETASVASYSGQVAVGTSTVPSGYKMAIDGNLIVEEVKVQLSGNWPDYVFDQDYKLPTLEEIRKHIQEKGHLPNIPSVKEVESNGIELGEMNRLLLEKIEELMLYTIKQQAIIESMQREIENLKKKDD